MRSGDRARSRDIESIFTTIQALEAQRLRDQARSFHAHAPDPRRRLAAFRCCGFRPGWGRRARMPVNCLSVPMITEGKRAAQRLAAAFPK